MRPPVCMGLTAAVEPSDTCQVSRVSAAPQTPAQRSLMRVLADTSEIEASRDRVRARLLGRERTVTLLLAGAFLAAGAACALFIPSSTSFSLGVAIFFVAIYAVVSQIEFEIGPGSAVPTELVLVPMLFALPAGAVPLCVAIGLLVGGFFERLRSRRHGDRVAVLLCSSWHSVGPALVIGTLADGPPSWSGAPFYVLALVAQFLFDAASVVIRHRLGRGTPLSRLLPPLSWVAIVDVTLAPVALLVAWAAVDEPAAIACILPLAGLLHFLGTERRRRIDESLALGRAVEDASRRARSDPLTGVGNRLAWQEAVADAEARRLAEGAEASVFLVDLDRLKETNDTHGHDTGDRLIQALASALQAAVRDADALARIGGDEFAVLVSGADSERCEQIAERIREQLAGLDVAGVPLMASLGAASCPPCPSLAAALRLADERLYADKASEASGL